MQTLQVYPSYWRATPTSTDILRCSIPGACLGTECAVGASGPLCSLCEPGYYSGSSGQCQKCDSDRHAKQGAGVVLFLVVLLGLAAVGFAVWRLREKLALLSRLFSLLQRVNLQFEWRRHLNLHRRLHTVRRGRR